jgi:iron complex transport system substrate-binding protein
MIRSLSNITYILFFICLISFPLVVSASDKNGNQPARVITTNICIDSLVVALIGTKNLIAVSALADDTRYSHISHQVSDLHKVTFNAEAIYALRPSLVLASNFSSAKTKFALEKLGVEVRLIDFARSINDIEKNIQILGRLLNADGRAQELVKLLKSPKIDLNYRKQIVALQYSTNRYVHGNNSLISDIINRSGFSSYSKFLGYEKGRYISAEALVKSAPNVLILDGDKSFNDKSGFPLYHPALMKGKGKSKALFIETKDWSCGTTKVVDLIIRLNREYIKLVGKNNAT